MFKKCLAVFGLAVVAMVTADVAEAGYRANCRPARVRVRHVAYAHNNCGCQTASYGCNSCAQQYVSTCNTCNAHHVAHHAAPACGCHNVGYSSCNSCGYAPCSNCAPAPGVEHGPPADAPAPPGGPAAPAGGNAPPPPAA